MKPASVSIIGAGNLAWHLAPALDNAGYAVREVYSRKSRSAETLAERLYQARACDSLDFGESHARIFILAVSDDAIEKVVGNLVLPKESILVHTSGGRSLSILGSFVTPNTGVLYPLQTFTRSRKINFHDVPFFVESSDSSTGKVLMALAKAVSRKVVAISSEERRALHTAAVFASNFTNHMLTLSKEVMVNHNLKFDLLKPLIAETLNKSLEIGPEKAQTGPARRGDLETLDSHMEVLKDDPAVAEIYRVISQHIIDTYSAE